MRVKAIQDENFQDYKLPSMFISTCFCDGKCWRELGLEKSNCQNEQIMQEETLDISDSYIVTRYLHNPITSAIVIGGLEPMLQFDEVVNFIKELRKYRDDPVVIYTGYYPEEIADKLPILAAQHNIIVKFGRYIPNKPSKFDEILGINLVSDNQYAQKL